MDIIGGVSPLKARQPKRGGKKARKATKTAKQRGGFAKAKGKRGGGGRNVGGYNVRTKFTPEADWTPPASGGTAYSPTAGAPYNPSGYKEYVPGTDPTEGRFERTLKEGVGTWDQEAMGRLPSWAEAWDMNLENVTKKYKSFDEYVTDQKNIKSGKTKGATKGEIQKSITEEKYVPGKAGEPGYWIYYNAEGEEVDRKYDKK